MKEIKSTETRMGWCSSGQHWKCRHIVKQSDTEQLVCNCPCGHPGERESEK